MSATTTSAPQTLDDVMLAMDVVDTLRHRERLVEAELAGPEREAALVARLKEIYAGQGIDVPERILVDGVKALEEKRFVYEPKGGGLARRLALLYVARGRWGRPLALVLALAAFGAGVYQFGVVLPARQVEARLERVLPGEIDAAYKAALALAGDEGARGAVEAERGQAVAAVAARDAKGAEAGVAKLKAIAADLSAELTIRIVSRPGEYSGVFRTPDDAPGRRNYYLVVEAVDPAGRPHALDVVSEEDQKTARVAKWGLRVSEAVFDAVAADKADDQIVENDVIGQKPRGALAPRYAIETTGGAITDWSR